MFDKFEDFLLSCGYFNVVEMNYDSVEVMSTEIRLLRFLMENY